MAALRVLLVQSEREIAKTLTRYYMERGDEVWQAWDLGQAMALVDQVQPTLMVLDLHYPGDGWIKFLRQLRRLRPEMRIVVTNKYPDLQRELLAQENGVRIFIRQPFTKRWLDQSMERLEADRLVQQRATPAPPLPRVRLPVRVKITLPYLVLALLFALASAYVISQVVLESVQDRFLNQLAESGRQNADWMVGEENRALASLRLMVNTNGVAQAIQAGDAEALRALILPLAVNSGEEDIEILDRQGNGLLALRHTAGGGRGEYDISRGDAFVQQFAFARAALAGKVENGRDKFAGLGRTPWGNLFFVSGPVYDAGGQVVGVLLVGNPVERLVREMHADSLAEVTLYDLNGQILASTLYSAPEGFPLPEAQAAQALQQQDTLSLTRDLTVSSTTYSEVLGPWEARGGEDMGVIGVSLAQVFLMRTSQATRVEIFVLVAAGILLVVLIGLALAGLITNPLVRLVQASTAVAQGNLEVKVDSHGDDEVAVLAQAFNNMVAGLQEGSIYRDLLGRTVSPEVREQLRQTFHSGDLRLEGQEAMATVLMSDIRAFTTLSERTDPSTMFNWLNEYYGLLVPLVNTQGGVVNKFDGDAMLAFFGILPVTLSPKESARAACRAALTMLQAVERLNVERAGRGEPALVTGFGVHTGLVRAGGLGASDRLHYTIIGDTVNTTQRLEDLTRRLFNTNGIVISHATYLALEDYRSEFYLTELGLHAVKGKSEQIMVYRLSPLSAAPKVEMML